MPAKSRFFDSLIFRLAFPLWILAAVIISIGIYQTVTKRHLSQQTQHMSHFDVPLLASMSNLASQVNATYLAERSMLTMNVKSEEYANTTLAHDTALVSATDTASLVENRLRGAQTHANVVAIQMLLQTWSDTTREVFVLRDRDTRMDRLLAIDLSGGDSAMQFGELIGEIDSFEAAWIEGIAQTGSDSAKRAQESIRNGSILGAVSALFGVVVAIMLPLWLVRRLHHIRDRIDEICEGDGDLGRQLTAHHNDEISEITRAFNRFSGQLNEAMQQTAKAAEVVAADAQEMARHNVQLSKQTEAQAANICEASDALEEITKAICSTSSHAGQASKDAQTTSDSATSGNTGIVETINAMATLSDSSRKINDITEVVEAIAFQTNILALNAAVEAARAGEQGRGFAVVANEVQVLAQRSTEAASDIKKLIDTASNDIEKSTTLAKKSGAMLDNILASAQDVAEAVSQISDSSHGQNQRVSAINESIAHIRDTMNSTTEFVDKMAATSKRLETQSADLMQVVNRYRSEEGQNSGKGSESTLAQ